MTPKATTAETSSAATRDQNVYVVSLNIAPFLPYIYGVLRAFAEEDPEVRGRYDFKQPFFFNHRPAEIVDGMENPAVLALSCYIWNFRQHMKTARLTKERYPDAVVVAGGPQIPDRPGEFFREHPYVDVIVHGEGELPFRGILRSRLEAEPDWSKIPGISFQRDGEVVTTPRASLDVGTLQRSPYLEGYLDPAIEFFRERGVPYYAPWETNRGCPYSCAFCDWGSATMSKVRQFDLDRLLSEVEFFGKMRVPLVHINDANFGLLVRDVKIASRLAEAREKYGFPQEMRLNFAKNSNDRVFSISQLWNERGMLNTTTLSMQATNDNVLEAIARKNIPVEQYKQLQHRYSDAGIGTYTEVILGLPEETRESFKRGLDYVLETGNHEDIRIYELAVLPNAPIADPDYVRRYGIKTVDKQLTMVLPGGTAPPQDEIEYAPTVIETSTMSRADWVDCSVYARMLPMLHSNYYTRYLSIHLRRRYDLAYHRFYGELQEYFLARPDSVLGGVLTAFHEYYEQYQQTLFTPWLGRSRGPREVEAFLAHRPWVTPSDWAWLCLAVEQDRFYAELREFLPTLGLDLGPELDDVLRFQQEIMLRPDYDEQAGKIVTLGYDLPRYFTDEDELVARTTVIHFGDTHMGRRRMPLGKNDPAKFVNAALPSDWSSARAHYRHQFEEAQITYPASADERTPTQ